MKYDKQRSHAVHKQNYFSGEAPFLNQNRTSPSTPMFLNKKKNLDQVKNKPLQSKGLIASYIKASFKILTGCLLSRATPSLI